VSWDPSVKDVEINSPQELTLDLDRPALAIPEMLYAYACPMLHRKFDERGGVWSKNPIGTGPFTMTEFAVGQKVMMSAMCWCARACWAV
jgi:peptide/nickel transport system substrate-binding protein